jgi:hypothetical protein
MVQFATVCLIAILGAPGQGGTPVNRKAKEPRRSTTATDKADREIAELRALVDDLRIELRVFKDIRSQIISEESVLIGMKLLLAEKQAGVLREELERARDRLRRAKESQDTTDYQRENVQPQIVASGGINREKTERAVTTVLERRKINAIEAEQEAQGEIATIQRRLETVGRYIDFLENKLSDEMEGRSVRTTEEDRRREPAVHGNSKLRIYYSPGCRNLNRIPDEELVRFESVSDAEQVGFRLATDCP